MYVVDWLVVGIVSASQCVTAGKHVLQPVLPSAKNKSGQHTKLSAAFFVKHSFTHPIIQCAYDIVLVAVKQPLTYHK